MCACVRVCDNVQNMDDIVYIVESRTASKAHIKLCLLCAMLLQIILLRMHIMTNTVADNIHHICIPRQRHARVLSQ